MKYPIIDKRGIDKEVFENPCKGNILIMTYGLPRSGKSTWARSTGWPVVEIDAIRLAMTGRRWWGPIEHEIWATALTMVRALFLAGHKFVIVDTPSYSREQRNAFLSSPDVKWLRFFKPINTPAETCCDRAIETYPELVQIIEWMLDNWEPILPEEGIALWPGNGISEWSEGSVPGTPSNERLKELAAKNPPPQEWFDGGEEGLFS